MTWINWFKQLLWSDQGTSGAGTFSKSEMDSTEDYANAPAQTNQVQRIQVGLVTTVGNYREHNEDNYYVPGVGTIDRFSEGLSQTLTGDLRSDVQTDQNGSASTVHSLDQLLLVPSGPFIVADGMGGQNAGEQASKIAVDLIPKELRQRLSGEHSPDVDQAIRESIKEAVAAANREIIAQAHLVPECSHMGTTVVLILFRNNRVYITGIGDSRAYRLRDGQIERLTRDHDLATALIEAGTLRPDEAEHHQFRHVLYSYLGSPDARNGPEEIRSTDLKHGDRFLLASDGLTGVIDDETLLKILSNAEDPQTTAQSLVDRALRNNSKDNVTCLVIFAD